MKKSPSIARIDFSRVILFGPRASGTSSVSSQLSRSLDLTHIEFDRLSRNRDGSFVSHVEFASVLKEVVQQPRWVAEGDFLEGIDQLAEPIFWPLATTAIWLDLPFLVTVRRLIARSYRRVVKKEEMWDGMQDNKYSLLKRVASGNAIRAYRYTKKAYPQLLERPEYSHLELLHLKSQDEVDDLLSFVANERR